MCLYYVCRKNLKKNKTPCLKSGRHGTRSRSRTGTCNGMPRKETNSGFQNLDQGASLVNGSFSHRAKPTLEVQVEEQTQHSGTNLAAWCASARRTSRLQVQHGTALPYRYRDASCPGGAGRGLPLTHCNRERFSGWSEVGIGQHFVFEQKRFRPFLASHIPHV